jgi:hypothetical protein
MDAGSQFPESAASPHLLSRRAVFLGSVVAVLAGAGAGVAAGVLRHLPGTSGQPAPPELASALSAEENLLAAVRTALAALPVGAGASVRGALTTIGNDHVAHLTALRAALAGYRGPNAAASTVITGTAVPGGPSGKPVTGPSGSSGQPSAAASPATPDGVRRAEERAGSAAAARAGRLTGRDATLLASIAACEATHATWLSAVLA